MIDFSPEQREAARRYSWVWDQIDQLPGATIIHRGGVFTNFDDAVRHSYPGTERLMTEGNDTQQQADMVQLGAGKVTGYQPQSPAAVEAVNAVKAIENTLGEFLETIRSGGEVFADPEWMKIGTTHLAQGFMAINRAIFQPKSKLKL